MAKKTEKIDVGHGCTDCVHYETLTNKEPCKSCDKWSNWEDKRLVNKQSRFTNNKLEVLSDEEV